jgi:hypothetical protein
MGAALPRREGDCISALAGLGKPRGITRNQTRAPLATGSASVKFVAPNLRCWLALRRRPAPVEMEF